MVVGIGCDLTQVKRVEASLASLGARFAERILSPAELADYHASSQPAAFVAKRFAAKEAFGKALGTGIGAGVSFRHITITHDELGKPGLELRARAQQLAAELGAQRSHLSLSDEDGWVLAFVVLSSN